MAVTPHTDIDRVRDELRQARQSERVHGAYLLSGPQGTGKQATARWFAELLLCRDGVADPCGRCHDCTLLARSDPKDPTITGHPDLIQLEPDGNQYKVEQIRVLQKDLSLVANEGGRRIALLGAAEALRAESSNALLKTLEEPPPHTTLILVCREPDRLPATVRSRTVHLRFRALPEREIQAALVADGWDAEDAWLAAAVGGGSVVAAQAWSENALETARELLHDLRELKQGAASLALDFSERFRGGEKTRGKAELAFAVIRAWSRRQVEEAIENGDTAAASFWLDRVEAAESSEADWRSRNLNAALLIEHLTLALVAR